MTSNSGNMKNNKSEGGCRANFLVDLAQKKGKKPATPEKEKTVCDAYEFAYDSDNSEEDATYDRDEERTSKKKVESWLKKIPKPSRAFKTQMKAKESLVFGRPKKKNTDSVFTGDKNKNSIAAEFELNKPPAELKEPTAELKKTTAKFKKPAAEFSKTTVELNKPTAELNKTTTDLNKTTADLNKLTAEMNKPLNTDLDEIFLLPSTSGNKAQKENPSTDDIVPHAASNIVDGSLNLEELEEISEEDEDTGYLLRNNSKSTPLEEQPSMPDDDDLLNDEDLQEIFGTPKTKRRGKKKNTCKFCMKRVTNYDRHLEQDHSEEEQVRELSKLAKLSKERRTFMRLIRNEVSFSEFLASDSPQEGQKYPCTYCKGLFTRTYLRRHIKYKCIVKKNDDDVDTGKKKRRYTNHLAEAQTMMACISDIDDNIVSLRLMNDVFSIMKPDNISFVAKKDPLIRFFGSSYLKKHARPQMKYPCSNKMRELARLLIQMRGALNKDTLGFHEILDPSLYDMVVHCTKQIAGYDEANKTYRAASLAAHLGNSLKQASSLLKKILLKKSKFIEVNDCKQKLKDVKNFRTMIVENWTDDVSSLALKTMNEKKWNKPVILPLTSDINKFRNHVIKIVDTSIEALKKNNRDEKAYRNLVEGTLVLVILFNRRRIGDVQYVYLDSYFKDFSTNNAEECLQSLSPAEKALTKHYKRIVTGGKGSRAVVILLPKNLQSYINFMIEIRTETKLVPAENPYLFALPHAINKWIGAQKLFAKFSKGCDLQNPASIGSNKLRKQIASIMQILNLDGEESAQFAQFMGHTEKTHNEFYKLPQDIYQTAKVSKLLMLMEKGQGAEFAGKTLTDIDINPATEMAEEDEEEDEEEVDNPKPVQLDESSSDSGSEKSIPINSKKIPVKCKRIRWTPMQIKIVKKSFAKHIANKQHPVKEECEELLEKYSDIFQDRTWRQLKAYVYNQYKEKLTTSNASKDSEKPTTRNASKDSKKRKKSKK